MYISEAIKYIGVDDTSIDLFESQYPVPYGVSYNSYLILDEKTAVLDTVDPRGTAAWLENLSRELGGRTPDYLIMHHLEPDHAGSIGVLAQKYPEMVLVGNAKTFSMLPKFFPGDYTGRTLTVKEGDRLSLGRHTLTFLMAPMVHWPEVMVSYESQEKILFSADGFGTFGAVGRTPPAEWDREAGRYYFNIVGKYGTQVQALLKKAAGLDIQTICPLHGPILRENLAHCIQTYDRWSRYEPESQGVLIAVASIHGNTARAAKRVAEILRQRGVDTVMADLCRSDPATAVEYAFRYGRMVAMSSSYDAGLFPPMDHFMAHLRDKGWKNRTVALVENGSWAPAAARVMRAYLENMKGIDIRAVYTLQGAFKEETDTAALEQLVDRLLA